MSRDRVSQTNQYKDKELTDTTKALIEIYKSAFGEQWRSVFSASVQISLNCKAGSGS